MRFLTIALILCGVFWTGANAASFDCAKAKSQMEKAICADTALGELDEKLGAVYSSVRSNLSESAKNKVRAHQVLWLKGVTSSCSSESKNKDSSKYVSCLTNLYKSRISFLEGYLKPIAGTYKYPALGAKSNISWDFFDGNSPASALTNGLIDKIVKLNDIQAEDELTINISLISKSIAYIEINIYSNGGAHPDFGQNWYYLDLAAPKELKADFFFHKTKIQELSKVILKKLKTGADKETLECYESIDEAYISDFFKSDLSSVKVGVKSISIQLGVPRYCRALDSVDIEINILKPYITENYKALLQ
jgi:uncharacterized protein